MMRKIICLAALLLSPSILAQDAISQDVNPYLGESATLSSSGTTQTDETITTATEETIPDTLWCKTCQDQSLWTRPKLLGDWGGVRSCLTENGIVPDIALTQFYQGVTSGGSDTGVKYGGKVDYNLTFLGEKLGLWKGSPR